MKIARLQFLRQRLDMGFGLVVEKGERQVGPQFAEGPGATVGDGVFVGDPDHQRLFVFENRVVEFLIFIFLLL